MNLIDAVDTYLIEKEKQGRVRSKHYPSDVNSCRRQLFYKWTTVPESNPIPAGGLWKMRMGDSIHNMIHDFLSGAGFEIIPEVSGQKSLDGLKYPIGFRIDNLFIDPQSGHLDGIEVKTGYGYGIRAVKSANEPKKSDLMQVVCYLWLADLERVYLIYIARDDGYRCQFIIEMKEGWIYIDNKKYPTDLVAEITERLRFIEDAIGANAIPDRDYRAAIKNGEIKKLFQKNKIKYATNWQCSYCRWQNLCWEKEVKKYADGDNSEDFGKETESGEEDQAEASASVLSD